MKKVGNNKGSGHIIPLHSSGIISEADLVNIQTKDVEGIFQVLEDPNNQEYKTLEGLEETNISSSNIILKPSFPPTLTKYDLVNIIKKTSKRCVKARIPNAFLLYRNELLKECRNKNVELQIRKVSKIASRYWKNEPPFVKEFYQKLVEDAKSLYNLNNFEFEFDKHVENEQRSGQVTTLHAAGLADLSYTQAKDVGDIIHVQNSSSGFLDFNDDDMDPCFYNGSTDIGIYHDDNSFLEFPFINNLFNSIHLNEPTVNIRCGNGLNVNCNSNLSDNSEFISTKASFSPGISATSYIEIEKLQKLLLSRKDYIDHLLSSQPVYAIGIDFHHESIKPCISCWVVKPLDIYVLECLEAMFENQFEAIYQISIPDKSDFIQNSSESSSYDHITGEFNSSNSTRNSPSNDEEKIFQKFTIVARLQADFSPPNLEYEIDLYSCKTGKMLSYNLPFYKRRGRGYFLDSVEVCVSPIPCIPNDKNDLFTSLNTAYPQQLNRTIEISNGRETGFEGQISGEFGAVPRVSGQAKVGLKNATNTKFTSDEWELNYSGCHTTGDSWSYRYVANNLDNDGNRRTSYVPGCHSAKWQTKKNMRGFRINITQVIRYKIYTLLQKPEFITCPVIAHNLEIAFNNFEDFNAKFAKLAKSNRGTYYNDDNINLGVTDIQNLFGKIKIERSFITKG
ncbi:14659_t:CDS:2 [Funneliformis geosporum]|nr:14659_t:CDS:2 [Funneliformis geosporum]